MLKPSGAFLAVLTLSFMAQPVAAQSLDLGSSMTAHCLGAPCSTVQFMLEVDGSSTVDVIRLFSDGSVWQFGSLVGVMDGSGADVTASWASFVLGGGLQLSAFTAPAAPEPLLLTVDMASSGTTSQLYDGRLTYSGQGFSGSNLVSIQGQVVPEPSTWLLLGTGLMGLGFVAWRRRDKDVEGSSV